MTTRAEAPVDVEVLRRAIGIDMTSSMLERARASAQAMGLTTVELTNP